MIFSETKIKLKDNSGCLVVKCIKTLKTSKKSGLKPLGVSIVSVRKIRENKNKIEKGKLYESVLIRRKKPWTRPNGDIISFSDNSMVLLNEKRQPIPSRIKGPIYREFRSVFSTKVLILSNFSV